MVAQYYVHYLDASCHKANIRSERFPIRPLLCMVCMDWQVSLTNWLEFRYRMNKFFFSISGWVKTAPQMLENNRNWIWFSHCHCLLLYIPINSLYEKIVWDTWSRARKKSNSKWALWGLTFVILPLHDENKNQTITILWTYKGSKKKIRIMW